MTDKKASAKLVVYVLPRRGDAVYLVRYRNAPNPSRQGWWIPAPELEHGEHPDDACRRVLGSLGLAAASGRLAGVDSFVTREWHVLFLYTADVGAEAAAAVPMLHADYEEGRWFPLDALPEASELAHGQWEKDLALRLSRE